MKKVKALKISEVASIMNVSHYLANKSIKDGSLKSFKVGSHNRVLESDLYEFMGIEPEPVEEVTVNSTEDTPADELRRFADRWKLNLIKR